MFGQPRPSHYCNCADLQNDTVLVLLLVLHCCEETIICQMNDLDCHCFQFAVAYVIMQNTVTVTQHVSC